jgi:hypothetical protein
MSMFFTGNNEESEEIQQFLLASLDTAASSEVILAGLKQCSNSNLCNKDTSGEIVNRILALISVRQEPVILDQSFKTISHEHLGFDEKSVAYPLLLQLKRSDLQVQKVIIKLLTIQAIKFPSLIIPVLRNFMRSTLVIIATDVCKTTDWKLETTAILCIALPALPPSLSRLYSKPVLESLIRSLKTFTTIGKGCDTCLQAISHVTASCSHVWDLNTITETVNQLQRLSSYASPKELARVLSCMAALMSIPTSFPLRESVMQNTFRQYVLSDTLAEPVVKTGVVTLIGTIGTADRNPITKRVRGICRDVLLVMYSNRTRSTTFALYHRTIWLL